LNKKLQSQTVSREKQYKTLVYKKAACEMLVKLTPDGIVGQLDDLQSLSFFSGEGLKGFGDSSDWWLS